MKLHNLQSTSSHPVVKRKGRGPGSGLGKTAGRGQKGQRARSGGKGKPGFEGGQTPLYRRIPKFGFTNINTKKYAIINLMTLEKFAAKSTIDLPFLIEAKLVAKSARLLKILGQGQLTKALTVKAHKFSQAAQKAITQAGGKTEVL